jgi:GT2 family glycosyltransferase
VVEETVSSSGAAETSIVLATRNRRSSVLRALERLEALPERPPVILVDNASTDGTPAAVRRSFPRVRVVALAINAGPAARNVGAELASTPYIAFNDDDSWWAPGALDCAAEVFEAHPRIALVAARVLVGEENRPDSTCTAMERSPLPDEGGLPGRPVLGFVACGAVVRRAPFLEAGGFCRRFGVGGEEQLLALDLAAAGWSLRYVPDAVAHHHPSPARDRKRREATEIRNRLWTAWMRRPVDACLRETLRVAVSRRTGLVGAFKGLPWCLRDRRVIPAALERQVRLLED